MGQEIEKGEVNLSKVEKPEVNLSKAFDEDKITITSDGFGTGTKVMFGDILIPCVTKIEIHPIGPDTEISATITLCDVDLAFEVNEHNITKEERDILLKIATARMPKDEKETDQI